MAICFCLCFVWLSVCFDAGAVHGTQDVIFFSFQRLHGFVQQVCTCRKLIGKFTMLSVKIDGSQKRAIANQHKSNVHSQTSTNKTRPRNKPNTTKNKQKHSTCVEGNLEQLAAGKRGKPREKKEAKSTQQEVATAFLTLRVLSESSQSPLRVLSESSQSVHSEST